MSETPPYEPQYVFTPACRALLEQIDLPESDVLDAYRSPGDMMLVTSQPAHMYAIRWLGQDRIVFLSASFSKVQWHVDRARPSEITIHLALLLRPLLPAGPISPRMQIDQIWTRIAESFGMKVCCHKQLGSHRRYTGRWDGAHPRWDPSGIEDDSYILDGVLEESGENVRYVWVLSTATYLNWLREEPFGGIAAGPADEDIDVEAVPRLLFSKMQPAKLSRPIIIRADIGETDVRLICTHSTMCTLDDPPHFHPAMQCLHVFGAEILDPEEIPRQLAGKEYVMPAHFVTDIRTGPDVLLTGGEAPQRSGVLPTGYRPGNKMGMRSMLSLLGDLTAP
jgi:hypothetical protein